MEADDGQPPVAQRELRRGPTPFIIRSAMREIGEQTSDELSAVRAGDTKDSAHPGLLRLLARVLDALDGVGLKAARFVMDSYEDLTKDAEEQRGDGAEKEGGR